MQQASVPINCALGINIGQRRHLDISCLLVRVRRCVTSDCRVLFSMLGRMDAIERGKEILARTAGLGGAIPSMLRSGQPVFCLTSCRGPSCSSSDSSQF